MLALLGVGHDVSSASKERGRTDIGQRGVLDLKIAEVHPTYIPRQDAQTQRAAIRERSARHYSAHDFVTLPTERQNDDCRLGYFFGLPPFVASADPNYKSIGAQLLAR